jgi:hypothetical protein
MSRSDRVFDWGKKGANVVIASGAIISAIPDPFLASKLVGPLISAGGVGLQAAVWVCKKCYQSFKRYENWRHQRNCTEYCEKCR